MRIEQSVSSEPSWPHLEETLGRERIQSDVEPLILVLEEVLDGHVVHRPPGTFVQVAEEQWKIQKAQERLVGSVPPEV